MCGTVALFREAQCGALHHLGYRSVSVFPHGSPGAQQNRRNRVHPGSIVVGLKCMQHSLGIRFGIRWSIRFVAFALALGKRRVVEGQHENIQSKKIILMLMRNVTGLCVIHSFNYGVIASRFIACYATSIRQGMRGWWRVDPHQHFLGGLPSSGSAAHQDSLEGKHSWFGSRGGVQHHAAPPWRIQQFCTHLYVSETQKEI